MILIQIFSKIFLADVTSNKILSIIIIIIIIIIVIMMIIIIMMMMMMIIISSYDIFIHRSTFFLIAYKERISNR
jgi:hypothetical protein